MKVPEIRFEQYKEPFKHVQLGNLTKKSKILNKRGQNKNLLSLGCFHLDYLVDLQTVILEIKRDGSRIGYESLSTGFPKLRITE